MSERKIYKHRFILTILSEECIPDWELPTLWSLERLQYRVTRGPDLGKLELQSCEEITGRDRIVQECIALDNDGGFFTDFWDEQMSDEL